MTTDFDLYEFLLPSNHNDNPADLRHGIPQVLKFRQGPALNSTSTAPLHYATQPHRLPFRVIHDPNLTSRMIEALRPILNESNPLNLRPLTITWEAHRYTEQAKTNGAEAEISQTSFDLLKVVCHSVNSLKSSRRAEQQPQHSTDGQVKVDHILHWDGLKEPVVLIEDRSKSVMETHLPGLLAVRPDQFRSTEQWNWEGALSIIAKLSWKATDHLPRYCKWAVLYAGDQFLIYHILRISEKDGLNPTTIMTYSDPVAINDTNTPYIALLVYMVLSTDQTHSSLATTLGVTAPEGTKILDEGESEEQESNRLSEEESNRRSEETVVSMLTNGADCTITRSLSEASEVTLTFMPNTSGKIAYKRIPIPHHPIPVPHTPAAPALNIAPEPDFPPSSDSPILTLTPISHGAVGVIYQAAEGCVVKFSRSPKTAGDVINEAVIYTILKASCVSRFIPRLFGLFRNGEITALILSNEGTPVTQFAELPLRERRQLYMMLANMHRCGILHGDFRPPNVLYGPRGPILIDFSHSKSAHICPPDGSCLELRDAQHQLKLADDDLKRKGSCVAFAFRAFFHRLPAGLLVRNGGRAVGATKAILAVATAFSLIS